MTNTQSSHQSLTAMRRPLSLSSIAALGLACGLLLCFVGFTLKTLFAQEPAPLKDKHEPTQQELLQKRIGKRVGELGGLIIYDSNGPGKSATNLLLPEKQAIDDDLTEIPQAFPKLQYIDLRSSRITDAGVEKLQGLQNLYDLELSETAVTDKSLEFIKSLPALRDLKLRKTKITDKGLHHLSGRSWGYLVLAYNGITERGLEALSECKSIEDLDLSGNPIGNKELVHLAKITSLHSLNLRDTSVSDIRVLETLTNLKSLGLSHTQVTDEALVHVKKFPNLSELHVVGTKVTRETIEQFRKDHPKVKCISEESKTAKVSEIAEP